MIKFTADKSVLSEALNTTAKAASTKTTIGVLEGIHMKLSGNSLTVTGYDLELGIKSTIIVDGGGDGELVVSSRLICDIVRKMPGSTISFEESENYKIKLSSDDVKYSISGISSEEYPLLPELSRGESFEVGEAQLKSMIGQTLYAVALDDRKPALMGTKFEIRDKNLYLVSVDGIRIALRKEKLDYEDFEFIVPAKTLGELLRLLSDDESKLATISVDRNQCIFKVEKYTVFSRLLEGDFFDYTKIISLDTGVEAMVNVRSLIEAVDRTLLLINDKCKAPVDLTFEDNSLRVFCETIIGRLDQTIDVDYSGDKFEISFSSRYLLDALRNCDSDKVKFSFVTQNMQALKITPLQGDSFLFLVSPVRRRQ